MEGWQNTSTTCSHSNQIPTHTSSSTQNCIRYILINASLGKTFTYAHISTEQQVRHPLTLFNSEALRAIFLVAGSFSKTSNEFGNASLDEWISVPLMYKQLAAVSLGTSKKLYLNLPAVSSSFRASFAAAEIPMAIKLGPAMDKKDFKCRLSDTGIPVTG